MVTAVGAGTAVITAKAGIAEATRIINVSGPSSIVLNFNNVTLDESENFTLIATVDNKDTTGKSVVWSSSNTDVVMVDNTGKVTAVAAGTATITAKAGDKSATCTITVKAKEVVEVPENPEVPKDAFYFWQSAAGTVVETGGVATGHGAGEGRVNYANGDYHTLSISAKKANIDTDYILITLDQPLAANDKLEITAYRNKDTDANGTLYILFENGHVIDEGDNVVWNNIALGQEPNTNTYAVGEGAGSKTIKLSRSKSSTNVFITKFVITRTADGIEEIEMVVPTENTIYNLQGQKIDASSIEALPAGLYIINGKKMVVK
ncbi:MAG: Ig-like domain-containing protein [Bacteroidaceae bacterium]|nr:Ig-like domain-containing protein [Bacteroidaceae bacterium]